VRSENFTLHTIKTKLKDMAVEDTNVKGHFDYVIVGAGSAGAALATRLTEDPDIHVLLLEAGEPRHKDFWVRTPVGVAKILQNPRYVWLSQTQPQQSLVGQQIYWPHGKLPGGSSSVNGMLFVRGDPQEYDHWEQLHGCQGWSFQDCLPYFKRLEATTAGEDTYRGRTGPITVTPLVDKQRDPLSDAFVDACEQAGIPLVKDYNGASYEGAAYLQLSTKKGQRSSTALGHLALAKGRKNLTLLTEAHALRVIFEGKAAVGIEYLHDNVKKVARARHEVVLSAGPIKTPQLLELSGIGQGDRLQALGIPVIHNAPEVGENLRDHLQARITYECTQPITLNDMLNSKMRTLAAGVEYLLTGRGIMSTPSTSAHAQAKTRPEHTRPEVKIQLHYMSGADRYANKGAVGLDPFPGFSMGFFQLRPESKGWIHIDKADPMVDPVIEPKYLTHSNDITAMLDALKLSRAVVAQPALQPFTKRETRPGIEVNDDDGLLQYIKECGQTSWHPIGTCRMGSDENSVVDPQLRVRGVQNLRVIDSSIMPTMPSSNTNAGSIMIGERGADFIRGRTLTK
jgi:choline dehydrogenase